jgi:hypothetical protein
MNLHKRVHDYEYPDWIKSPESLLRTINLKAPMYYAGRIRASQPFIIQYPWLSNTHYTTPNTRLLDMGHQFGLTIAT